MKINLRQEIFYVFILYLIILHLLRSRGNAGQEDEIAMIIYLFFDDSYFTVIDGVKNKEEKHK